MPHHTNQVKPCPLCSVKLDEAHPELKTIGLQILEEFPDCHISWAFRNEKDQNEFYAEKRSREKWPNSKHNVMVNEKPCARALDLFKLDIENEAWFPPKYYVQIAAYLTDQNAPMEWSGAWTHDKDHFCEMDHFQLASEVK